MQTLEWTWPADYWRDGRGSVPPSEWGPGPWEGEPDKAQWPDPETGLPCLARRGGGGAWCGYVAVPPGHPWYDHDDPERLPVDVHGGVTFSAFCSDDKERGVCHIPEPGEPDPAFWLGFDCSHSMDQRPAPFIYDLPESARAAERRLSLEGTYRTLDYVRAECARLAQAIVAAGLP